MRADPPVIRCPQEPVVGAVTGICQLVRSQGRRSGRLPGQHELLGRRAAIRVPLSEPGPARHRDPVLQPRPGGDVDPRSRIVRVFDSGDHAAASRSPFRACSRSTPRRDRDHRASARVGALGAHVVLEVTRRCRRRSGCAATRGRFVESVGARVVSRLRIR